MKNCKCCGKLVADKSGYVLGYKVFCCKECYEKGRERQREEEEFNLAHPIMAKISRFIALLIAIAFILFFVGIFVNEVVLPYI